MRLDEHPVIIRIDSFFFAYASPTSTAANCFNISILFKSAFVNKLPVRFLMALNVWKRSGTYLALQTVILSGKF